MGTISATKFNLLHINPDGTIISNLLSADFGGASTDLDGIAFLVA